MNEELYLYGASVQGIQSFIFQTDSLKDIVGASELIDQICASEFKQYETADGQIILKAAGNIKYIFKSKEECEKVVREFPKVILRLAPGITISQAVVKYHTAKDFSEVINELEAKLHNQRNKPFRSLTTGIIGMGRSRKTGLPVVECKKGDYLDAGTRSKLSSKYQDNYNLCKKCFGDEIEESSITKDINEFVGKNNWIAVIHADGNGLGKVVQELGTNPKLFNRFSVTLDDCTKHSAQRAYDSVKGKFTDKIIPIRPIVLGGDDLTIVCRADLAVEYTKTFMSAFEELTKSEFSELVREFKADISNGQKKVLLNGLTACAGIAFIKASYPFYYGYQLAEKLCGESKSESRKINSELPPSSLMFHKVQDSFVEDYDLIVKRELKVGKYSLNFGPYYLNAQEDIYSQRWTIQKLLEYNEKLSYENYNEIKSNLREWLGVISTNPSLAEQKLKRLKSLKIKYNRFIDDVTLQADNRIPIYDLLSLHTIVYQNTK